MSEFGKFKRQPHFPDWSSESTNIESCSHPVGDRVARYRSRGRVLLE